VTHLSSFCRRKKPNSIADFGEVHCSANALEHIVSTGLNKFLTCGSFPTQASDEHLPVGEERTADEIYAHKKFAQVTPSFRSNETRSRQAEIQLTEAINLPWIVLEVDFGGS